jgi:hypothetical protein
MGPLLGVPDAGPFSGEVADRLRRVDLSYSANWPLRAGSFPEIRDLLISPLTLFSNQLWLTKNYS